uniref:RecQ-mediated genome instability protein 2 n=1 Tax=Leersia perrieri TaxID=77586 RepID=A0A0D9VXJ0_9ORYZ
MEGSGTQPSGGAAAAAPKRNNMDYSLAALKVFGCQLAGATYPASSEPESIPQAQMLYGIRFQRVWLQGVVVLTDYGVDGGIILVDDGSCVAEITLTPKETEGQPWREGMYVLVIGSYDGKISLPRANRPLIKVHKLVDLSAQPDREAMWYMEVAEAYNFFYLQSSAANP